MCRTKIKAIVEVRWLVDPIVSDVNVSEAFCKLFAKWKEIK